MTGKRKIKMEQRKLGNSGLTVPVVGMGTWKTFNVRGADAEGNCQEIVRTAFEKGANFFDSSPMYGEAERVLGAGVKRLGIRDKVMIATKVWTDSDEKSEKQFADAFNYFGGYVDFYQVHNLVAWETRLNQLERFKAEGKVRSIGVTHYSHSAFDKIAEIMRSGRITGIQIPYNAVDREVEKVILPLAGSLNIGVVVMRPFGEGSLLRHVPSQSELAQFAEYGVTTWAQILLKWVVSDPRVSVAIPATSRVERMAENSTAGLLPFFDQATREKVSQIAKKYN
jgi:aryl-alcohol dehydrogenase-like predicted oxidoreductase